MEDAFVVKVQAPLFVSGGEASYLLYPEDGSWDLMVPVGEDKDLDEVMKGTVKRYFWARIDAQDRCELLVRLPCDQNQDW